MSRVYNFSAGPSMLPEEVLKQAQAEFLDYNGSGMSVCEMSHRSKVYTEINDEAEALLRELMGISDDYHVMFVQGGASTQFEAVPLNLLGKNNKADYCVTGNFANKASKEAQKYADVHIASSSKDANYTFIPKEIDVRSDAAYVHITNNNTIFGTEYHFVPDTKGVPLVSDMSSDILSRPVNVNDYSVIYAGAQKNIAPAGVTIVIAKKELVDNDYTLPYCPTMLKWSTQAKEHSLYNTPPCFSTYMAMLVFRHIKKLGGVEAMAKYNAEKAAILYDFLDSQDWYKAPVAKEDRSLMNVPFVSPSDELNAKFVKEAAAVGLTTLKGHRLVGGMRASIYNAMPIEGVKKLVEFMKQFAVENK